MMAAFAQDRDVVTVEDVRAAIEELQWVEYAERSVKLQALAPHSCAAGTCTCRRRVGRAARRARPHPGRLQRPDDRGARADARPLHHRPHARQRSADRQQVHQPSSRADHHVGAHLGARRSEQHQRHLRARQARAPPHAQRRRRGADRPARDHVFRRAPVAHARACRANAKTMRCRCCTTSRTGRRRPTARRWTRTRTMRKTPERRCRSTQATKKSG